MAIACGYRNILKLNKRFTLNNLNNVLRVSVESTVTDINLPFIMAGMACQMSITFSSLDLPGNTT
jgi:hypothetical protein